MRIATHSVSDSVVRQIQKIGSQQARLQNQVATGQRIFQPEDDPIAVSRVLNLESESRQMLQYTRNADRALEISQATYSGLQGLKKISDRGTEIGTLGSAASDVDATRAYATEVEQLLEQALQLANSKLGNDYLYAGTAVDAQPFVATRDGAGRITAIAYAGNTDRAEIPLSASTTVTPNSSGDTNQAVGDFLNNLMALRDGLLAADHTAVQQAQSGLLATEDALVSALGEHGGVQTRIEASQAQVSDIAATVETRISDEADADMPSTIVKLTQSQTAYQAALQSAANIMKLSLLDYIN
ncbi:MAG: flagellin [Verrucomicrobia bacterium]|nr:flagellin [Verrucomicrobiota bacterium]